MKKLELASEPVSRGAHNPKSEVRLLGEPYAATGVTIVDGQTVPVDDDMRNDLLWHRLKKSVRETAPKTETV